MRMTSDVEISDPDGEFSGIGWTIPDLLNRNAAENAGETRSEISCLGPVKPLRALLSQTSYLGLRIDVTSRQTFDFHLLVGLCIASWSLLSLSEVETLS